MDTDQAKHLREFHPCLVSEMVQTRQEADRIAFAYTTLLAAIAAVPVSADSQLTLLQAAILSSIVLLVGYSGVAAVMQRGAAFQRLWDSLLRMEEAFGFYDDGKFYDTGTVLPKEWIDRHRTLSNSDRWQYLPHVFLLIVVSFLACLLMFVQATSSNDEALASQIKTKITEHVENA